MSRSMVPALTFASLTLALAAACGGSSNDDGPAATLADTLSGVVVERMLALGMRDIAFDSDRLEIAVGAVAEIALSNEGNLTHDFTIERIDAETTVTGRGSAGSGRYDVHVVVDGREDALLLLRVADAGEYSFFCAVSGHRQAGMEGTLTVR